MPVTTGWDHGPWANCGRRAPRLPLARGAHRRRARPAGRARRGGGDGGAHRRAVGAQRRATTRCPSRRPRHGATAGSTPATRSAPTTDGWYYFVDRKRDTIRRRGENISSFEVETLVLEHPDVVECAADRRARPRWATTTSWSWSSCATRRRSTPPRCWSSSSRGCPSSCCRATWTSPTTCPHRGVDARPQARAARPRRHPHHLGPRGLAQVRSWHDTVGISVRIVPRTPGGRVQAVRAGARARQASMGMVAVSSGAVTTWMHTWSAPASWCSCTRAGDGRLVAPGDEGVAEAVAAAVEEIVLGEPGTHPVVRVVGQAEVDLQVVARRGAGLVGVGSEVDGLLGGEQRARPQDLARRTRVLRAGRDRGARRPCGRGRARASWGRAPRGTARRPGRAASPHRGRRGRPRSWPAGAA